MAQSGNPTPNPSLLNVVPPSPNAASLGKFGDVPVGYFTGVPQINVPIYSYKNADNSLSMSISLDYHAGGIKVDELASNTGIGWALNAGGVITRTRRGIADEDMNGGFRNTPVLPNEYEGNRYAVSKYMEINAGVWDSQSDIFNFNVGGKSGKFMFGKNNDFLMLTPNKIRVIPEIQPDGAWTHIKKFTLIDETGTQYVFDAIERTSVGNAYFDNYVSSWYLTKITAPFSPDNISFEYEDEMYGYASGRNASMTRMLDVNIADPPISGGFQASVIMGKRIKRISLPDNTKVDFGYDTNPRTDLDSYNNPGNLYRLKQIAISNGTATRGYNLYHDYSVNRLTLKSVIPYSAAGEDKGYSFEYYSALPNRLTGEQDHWGFYNTNPSNDLFPHEYININGTGQREFAGGNRETDVERVKYGSLTKMYYPTGGYTQFEMESHVAYDTRLKRDIITNIRTQYSSTMSVYCSNTQNGSEAWHYGGDANVYTNFKVKFYTSFNPTSATLTMQLKNSLNQVVNTQVIPFSSELEASQQISIYNLAQGNYTWNASVQGVDYFSDYVTIEWTESRVNNPDTTILHINNPNVGGLRIKSIKDFDGIAATPVSAREYDYLLEDGITSSGALGTYPEYTYGVFYDDRIVCGPIVDDPNGYRTYFNNGGIPNAIVRSFSPVQTLAMTNGSPVNYTRVVEKFVNNGNSNGRIDRYFTSYGTNGVPAQHNYPFAPPDYTDWSYGKLTKELVYDKNNNLLKKTENDYLETQDVYYNTPGRLANFTSISIAPVEFRWENYMCDNVPGNEIGPFTWSQVVGPTYFLTTPFTPVSGRKDLTKTTVTEYNGAATLVNEVAYARDQNYNVAKTTTKNSRNELIEEVVRYPYSFTGNAIATSMLSADNNMYAVPIAVEKWKTIGGTKYLTGGIVNQYQQSGTAIRKSIIESLETTSPVPESSVPAIGSSLNRAPALIKPKIEFQQYTSKGFIAQQAKVGDAPQSIIWDYNQQYPIAQVIGSQADQIGYTSFESDGTGNLYLDQPNRIVSGDGVTGNKCFEINGVLARFGLDPAKTYVVTLWTKNGIPDYNGYNGSSLVVPSANSWTSGQTINGWTYREKTLTGVTTINIGGGGGVVDEVRIYPVGAQMTTYTYNPLYGVINTCDANNRITYYEYDGFGRLKNVLDENKNILKHYDYQFQKNTNQ